MNRFWSDSICKSHRVALLLMSDATGAELKQLCKGINAVYSTWLAIIPWSLKQCAHLIINLVAGLAQALADFLLNFTTLVHNLF